MIEEIEDFLEDKYEYLTIEIEKGKYTIEFVFYISIRLTDFKNNDTVKSIHFTFYWNKQNTTDSNLRQIKSKIDNSIVKFFMKEV